MNTWIFFLFNKILLLSFVTSIGNYYIKKKKINLISHLVEKIYCIRIACHMTHIVRSSNNFMSFYFPLLTSYRSLLALKLSNHHAPIYEFFSEIALVQKKLFFYHIKMPKYQVKVRSHKITLNHLFYI